jgi:hypothetical protein
MYLYLEHEWMSHVHSRGWVKSISANKPLRLHQSTFSPDVNSHFFSYMECPVLDSLAHFFPGECISDVDIKICSAGLTLMRLPCYLMVHDLWSCLYGVQGCRHFSISPWIPKTNIQVRRPIVAHCRSRAWRRRLSTHGQPFRRWQFAVSRCAFQNHHFSRGCRDACRDFMDARSRRGIAPTLGAYEETYVSASSSWTSRYNIDTSCHIEQSFKSWFDPGAAHDHVLHHWHPYSCRDLFFRTIPRHTHTHDQHIPMNTRVVVESSFLVRSSHLSCRRVTTIFFSFVSKQF